MRDATVLFGNECRRLCDFGLEKQLNPVINDGLMTPPSRRSWEDSSAESNVDYGGPTQEVSKAEQY